MGRKSNPLPQTSHDAFKSAVPHLVADHHQKIISSLGELKIATYEKIADHLKMDRHQIGRRLSELERMGVVYKPGLQLRTKSGRNAFCYALTSTPVQTPVQIVDSIIYNATKPEATQTELF